MVTELDAAQHAAARAELTEVAALLAEQAGPLSDGLAEQFRLRIVDLPHDPTLDALLFGSTQSNLESLAHLLRGHLQASDVAAPPAAVEYARRLAQRGTPPSALLRAYRLGQQSVLAWAGERIDERCDDPRLALDANLLLTQISFTYVDQVSEEVISAYQMERERWLTNRSAVQRETVEQLLRGERVEVAAAESALGYRLRQHHLGLVMWTEKDDLAVLEHLAVRVATALGASGQPLFVPRDRGLGWAWVPIGRSAEIAVDEVADVVASAAKAGERVHVAVGLPGAGEPGFCATHEQAAAAQVVAQVGEWAPGTVIAFGDPGVRAAALLARDLAGTRRMVVRNLGDLAEDSEGADRLRDTLLAFVEERESYVATAARVHLHKNTVKYRIDRAIEARGKPLGEDRLDLELALLACKWLGPAVLVPEGRRS